MNSFRQLTRGIKMGIYTLIAGVIILGVVVIKLNLQINTLENPQAVNTAEIKRIVADVGRFIVLPKDEMPTLATVSDPAKLKDQAFFANSEVGDKVLVYTNARKAVLWRPSIKKIIEVSTLNVNVPETVAPVKK